MNVSLIVTWFDLIFVGVCVAGYFLGLKHGRQDGYQMAELDQMRKRFSLLDRGNPPGDE